MTNFYIVISGSGLDRKIDFSERNIMMPTGYFLNKKGEFTRNPFIPKCKQWFLDSGGFSLLSIWSEYPFTLEEYATLIERKKPTYAATMDYACEPELTITKKTKEHSKDFNMPVRKRIELTVINAELLIESYDFNGVTTIIPVIQGWKLDDYKYCIDLYHKKGLLTDYVAFGSMCRRLKIREARRFVVKLTDYLWRFCDAKIHFFGFKISFLKDFAIQERIYSVDTAAWTHNSIKTSKKKQMYAKTQKELMRNYYAYIKKVDAILKRFEKQQKLPVDNR